MGKEVKMPTSLFDDEESENDVSPSGVPHEETPNSLADEAASGKEPAVLASFTPESTDETIRRSGLAWSAGIVFFSAIAFMLFLGWLADLLLGSSPWGIVGGIVLGSIIGFIQFFRLSSQIFDSDKPSDAARSPLSRDDPDD